MVVLSGVIPPSLPSPFSPCFPASEDSRDEVVEEVGGCLQEPDLLVAVVQDGGEPLAEALTERGGNLEVLGVVGVCVWRAEEPHACCCCCCCLLAPFLLG